jgi:hypothetical protein
MSNIVDLRPQDETLKFVGHADRWADGVYPGISKTPTLMSKAKLIADICEAVHDQRHAILPKMPVEGRVHFLLAARRDASEAMGLIVTRHGSRIICPALVVARQNGGKFEVESIAA